MREVLTSLYDETPTATMLCNADGRIIAANGAAEQLTGYAGRELVGRRCSDLVLDGASLAQTVQDALVAGTARCALEFASRAGRVRVECDIFPARMNGRVVGTFVQCRVEQNALADVLTGLPNRALLADRIEQTLMTARRYRYCFALMDAGLDEFERVNERIGRAGGDEALRIVACRIRETLRESDTIAYAGDEGFVILQPMIDGSEDAVDLVQKITFAMQAPVTVGEEALDLRMSVGVAVFPSDGESGEELTAAAKRALQRAKRDGRPWCLATSRKTVSLGQVRK